MEQPCSVSPESSRMNFVASSPGPISAILRRQTGGGKFRVMDLLIEHPLSLSLSIYIYS